MDNRTETIINRLLWDYDINPNDVISVIKGKKKKCAHWDYEHILLRMLERLNWYDILFMLGKEKIKHDLTPSIISKIHNKDQKKRYEYIRRVLHKESVSYTEWGPEFSKRIRNTLFSDRWYST